MILKAGIGKEAFVDKWKHVISVWGTCE